MVFDLPNVPRIPSPLQFSILASLSPPSPPSGVAGADPGVEGVMGLANGLHAQDLADSRT